MKRNLTKGIAAAVAILTLALAAAVASAAQYPPAPKGDDIAFVQLGSVGEFVDLAFLHSAATSDLLTAPEKKLFERLAAQRQKALDELNAVLGEEATGDEAFDVTIPAGVLRSRAKTIALAARFERLLAGLYLGGVESTVDPPTRLLIGRQLAASSRNLALLRELRGAKPNLRATEPLSVEYVGIQFDHYLGVAR